MPKIVDKDARRTEIVDAYLRVVAREGARAATSRAVAGELGASIGSLWHYFDDFDAVLAAALRRIAANTRARIDAATSGLSGLAAARAALGEMLPLSPEAQDEATVVVTFWGRVVSQPDMGRIQSDVEAEWRSLLTAQLHAAVAAHELAADTPVDDLVDTLLVLAAGQQVEHVLRTSVGSPSRQRSLLDHALAPWRPRGA